MKIKRYLTIALGTGLLALAATAHAGTKTSLVIFGDSLSDPGNAFAVLGASSRAPYDVIPSAPYAIGGHHFSNGRTWSEQLAGRNVPPASAAPAFAAPGRNTNYAFGGARARDGATGFPLQSFAGQRGAYLADTGGNALTGAVHIVFLGGNDIRDALESLNNDPGGATAAAILSGAVTAVADGIGALYAAGAREFIVVNAPDVGLTPALRLAGPAAQGAATFLSAQYNSGLAQAVAALGGLPGIAINSVDLFSAIQQFVADPAAAGFVEAESPCLAFGTVANAICRRPNRHLFWDGIHPTTAGHAQLAELIGGAL